MTFHQVWLWDEWPDRWGADAGIDLTPSGAPMSASTTTTFTRYDAGQRLVMSAPDHFGNAKDCKAVRGRSGRSGNTKNQRRVVENVRPRAYPFNSAERTTREVSRL